MVRWAGGEREVSRRWAGGEQEMSGKWAVVVEVQELHLCITLHLIPRTLNLSRLGLDLCKAICWRKYCQRYNRPRRRQVKTGKKWSNFKCQCQPPRLVWSASPSGYDLPRYPPVMWWGGHFIFFQSVLWETPYSARCAVAKSSVWQKVLPWGSIKYGSASQPSYQGPHMFIITFDFWFLITGASVDFSFRHQKPPLEIDVTLF